MNEELKLLWKFKKNQKIRELSDQVGDGGGSIGRGVSWQQYWG